MGWWFLGIGGGIFFVVFIVVTYMALSAARIYQEADWE